MRIEVVEDIKISIAQNTESKLSKIPERWKNNLANDSKYSNMKSLNHIKYLIEQDVERMLPSNT